MATISAYVTNEDIGRSPGHHLQCQLTFWTLAVTSFDLDIPMTLVDLLQFTCGLSWPSEHESIIHPLGITFHLIWPSSHYAWSQYTFWTLLLTQADHQNITFDLSSPSRHELHNPILPSVHYLRPHLTFWILPMTLADLVFTQVSFDHFPIFYILSWPWPFKHCLWPQLTNKTLFAASVPDLCII